MGPFLRHHYGDEDRAVGQADDTGATTPALHGMSSGNLKAMFAKQASAIGTPGKLGVPTAKGAAKPPKPEMAKMPSMKPVKTVASPLAPIAPKAGHAPSAKHAAPHAPHAEHKEHKEKEGGSVKGKLLSAAGKATKMVGEVSAKTAAATVAGSGSEQVVGSLHKAIKGGHH